MQTDKILELAKALAERHGRLSSAEWVMRKFGILTFGIERVECAGRSARYVNRGDTYDRTVYVEHRGEFGVGSWGDWYESAENAHCADENVVRCGYCGSFTPIENNNWRETQCEHCKRNVAG